MHDLDKFLPPPLNKGDKYDQLYWNAHNKELSEDDICVATKDGLLSSMQDEMEDKGKYYISFHH